MTRGTTLIRYFLTKVTLQSANTLLRCDVRSRRDLCESGRPRNSETMFGKPFCTSFHHPRLSVTYLPAYSSLHCLSEYEIFRLQPVYTRKRLFVNKNLII